MSNKDYPIPKTGQSARDTQEQDRIEYGLPRFRLPSNPSCLGRDARCQNHPWVATYGVSYPHLGRDAHDHLRSSQRV